MFNGTKFIQCLVKLIIFVFFILSHGTALSDQLVTLTVKAFAATPAKGQALLSVFDAKEHYLKQPLYEDKQAIDGEGTATFFIEGLRPGTYSPNVVYDEDGDGELDTGLFGIPKEKIAFSNKAGGTIWSPQL